MSASHFIKKSAYYLMLSLLALMPWHAFLSVWLGNLIGHGELIQVWKEIVIALVAVAALIALANRTGSWREKTHPLNTPVIWLTSLFIITALASSAYLVSGWTAFFYGVKIDLAFLVLFVAAFILAPPGRAAVRVVLVSAVAAAAFALALGTILAPDFLSAFGYGPSTILPYRLVDPAIDTIRTPGSFGGPNQMGAFMLIPLSLIAARFINRPRWWHAAAFVIVSGALTVSYSRSAWIGGVVALFATVIAAGPWKKALAIIGGLIFAAFAALAAALNLIVGIGTRLQYYILHATHGTEDIVNSTFQHAIAFNSGLKMMLANPGGLGLGAAGPASFHAALSVIPENYFVQIAIETGWLGAALFIAINAVLAVMLWRRRRSTAAAGLFGALAGLTAVNLFLHGWADSSVAIVFWLLAAIVIKESPEMK